MYPFLSVGREIHRLQGDGSCHDRVARIAAQLAYDSAIYEHGMSALPTSRAWREVAACM